MQATNLNRLLALIVVLLGVGAMPSYADQPAARFETLVLDERFYSEGVCVADIDGDGHRDIVSGPFWYRGPEFRQRQRYRDAVAQTIKEESEHRFLYAHDFNGDDAADLLVIGSPGEAVHWYENPTKEKNSVAPAKSWRRHLVLAPAGSGRPLFEDLLDTGTPQLICRHEDRLGLAVPQPDPTQPWRFQPLAEVTENLPAASALGVGDLDGDGRDDLIQPGGWWRQTSQRKFKFHAAPFSATGGTRLFVSDFDGDGDNDVVSIQGEDASSLTWFERRGNGLQFSFEPHRLLTQNPTDNRWGLRITQMYGLAVADIDGDGVDDLITGKRYFAHHGQDASAFELPVLYWFRTTRKESGVEFEPHLISTWSGAGTQLAVTDVFGDGKPDIVVANKLGTYLFRQRAEPGGGEAFPAERANRATRPRHVAGTQLFSENVRSTEPLTAEDEARTFTLPPGFEIQLVAAEPDIAKPMNLAFDARGRLWVSSSREYPFAAADPSSARDTIRILEDTDGDGKADVIKTFADGLNIPMGLYPYRDGVICFTIPDIVWLRDTDGDDRADERIQLLGPFGTDRDTHGLCNGFTRGLDGWLYACHGFNNISRVAGGDGHQIEMQSGNTFRLQVDGSRVEHYTHGQVNPFGLTFDRYGDLFSADCHTKPITLLLEDGYYQSFGRPHDGLGFVPAVMQHLHGSTGIAGIADGWATQFPDVYRDSFFGGNVVTGRINRNSIRHDGSTVSAIEEPDFLLPGDPWFRPVDLQVGPDGALYIADFYNRIIGHYEVDLHHPGRDRHRGRIWRVVYSEPATRRDKATVRPATATTTAAPDLTSLATSELIELFDSNLETRSRLIVDELASRDRKETAAILKQALTAKSDHVRIYSLWSLSRLAELQFTDLRQAAMDRSPRVRTHAYRVIEAWVARRRSQGKPLSDEETAEVGKLLSKGFDDSTPMVCRAAVQSADCVRNAELCLKLFTLHDRAAESDVHLRHAIKLALRDQLSDPELFQQVAARIDEQQVSLLAAISLGVQRTHARQYIVEVLPILADIDRTRLPEYLTFAVSQSDAEAAATVAGIARDRFAEDVPFQLKLLAALRSGLQPTGQTYPKAVTEWAVELAFSLLGVNELEEVDVQRIVDRLGIAWHYEPYPGRPPGKNPWVVSRRRRSAANNAVVALYSSFPEGESETGIFRSTQFTAGPAFEFLLAGHDGFPGQPPGGKNLVRMRDAATLQIVYSAIPPRDDDAHRIHWDTSGIEGRQVYLELVDGDAANAYAWLAAGQFSEASLNPSRRHSDFQLAIELYREYSLTELRPLFQHIAKSSKLDPVTQSLLLDALVTGQPQALFSTAARSIALEGMSKDLYEQATRAVLDQNGPLALEAIEQAFRQTGLDGQQELASMLAAGESGTDELLDLVEQGIASARVLKVPAIEQKLESLLSDEQRAKLERLTAALPAEDERLLSLINERIQSFVAQPGSVATGKKLFDQHCSNCHQIENRGKQVGPNLDGIGTRGVERIAEDVLLPNRNIDQAFRSTIVITNDGRALSGLAKPGTAETLVLVDQQGKETILPLPQIEQKREARLSPMPSNFGDVLNEQQFRDLLAYLLSVRQ